MSKIDEMLKRWKINSEMHRFSRMTIFVTLMLGNLSYAFFCEKGDPNTELTISFFQGVALYTQWIFGDKESK